MLDYDAEALAHRDDCFGQADPPRIKLQPCQLGKQSEFPYHRAPPGSPASPKASPTCPRELLERSNVERMTGWHYQGCDWLCGKEEGVLLNFSAMLAHIPILWYICSHDGPLKSGDRLELHAFTCRRSDLTVGAE